MNDTTAFHTRRADEARRKLLNDIVAIKKMGNQMIENTELEHRNAFHKAGTKQAAVTLHASLRNEKVKAPLDDSVGNRPRDLFPQPTFSQFSHPQIALSCE